MQCLSATALYFSHARTNEDGVSLPEVSEERKCRPPLLCEMHLPTLAAQWEVVILNHNPP